MFEILLASALSIPASLGPAWAEFSKTPDLRHTKTIIEIGTLGFDKESKQLVYWLRKQEIAPSGQVSVLWAESKTCAATESVLAELSALKPPSVSPPGLSEQQPITLHGTNYAINAPSSMGGKIQMSSNVGTPIAKWVDSSLAALGGCWTETVPKRVR